MQKVLTGITINETASFTEGVNCLFSAATFDLQTGNTSDGIEGVISVIGYFINNTIAKGFFVVLQCDDGSADVFRAVLPRENSSTSLSRAINNVPPST